MGDSFNARGLVCCLHHMVEEGASNSCVPLSSCPWELDDWLRTHILYCEVKLSVSQRRRRTRSRQMNRFELKGNWAIESVKKLRNNKSGIPNELWILVKGDSWRRSRKEGTIPRGRCFTRDAMRKRSPFGQLVGDRRNYTLAMLISCSAIIKSSSRPSVPTLWLIMIIDNDNDIADDGECADNILQVDPKTFISHVMTSSSRVLWF